MSASWGVESVSGVKSPIQSRISYGEPNYLTTDGGAGVQNGFLSAPLK